MAVRGAVADVLTGCAGPIPTTKANDFPVRIEEAHAVRVGIALADRSQTWTTTSGIPYYYPVCCHPYRPRTGAGIVGVAFPVASCRISQAIPGTGTGSLDAFALPVTAMGQADELCGVSERLFAVVVIGKDS